MYMTKTTHPSLSHYSYRKWGKGMLILIFGRKEGGAYSGGGGGECNSRTYGICIIHTCVTFPVVTSEWMYTSGFLLLMI